MTTDWDGSASIKADAVEALAQAQREANALRGHLAAADDTLAKMRGERDEWRGLARELRVQESRISGTLIDTPGMYADPQPEAVAELRARYLAAVTVVRRLERCDAGCCPQCGCAAAGTGDHNPLCPIDAVLRAAAPVVPAHGPALDETWIEHEGDVYLADPDEPDCLATRDEFDDDDPWDEHTLVAQGTGTRGPLVAAAPRLYRALARLVAQRISVSGASSDAISEARAAMAAATRAE